MLSLTVVLHPAALVASMLGGGEAADGATPLVAGTAPLLSPFTLVIAGAGLVAFAMLRTKLRDDSK